MTRWLDRPAILLLGTGLFLGFYFPIGKQATLAGVDPIAWSLVISLVPGAILLLASWITDKSAWSTTLVPFGLFAGLTAYVIPNSVTFAAIPHVGSGYMALMFALSPVFTALLSMIVRVRPPSRKLLSGVAAGFAGALLIVFGRSNVQLADAAWPIIALSVPSSLAVGNVYRTARWPRDTAVIRVGAAANLGSVPFYMALIAALPGFGAVSTLHAIPLLTTLQIAVSLAMFLLFFRLQWVGGPTYLSQIGYVAAAVGLLFGSLLMGETYPTLVWLGAAAIAAAFAISNWPENARKLP